MIADDHEVIRMATRLMLENAGHEVVGEASNGVEVVSEVRNLSPDLIILDMDMPHLDGFAVLQRLHAEPDPAKIIVFSGLDASRYAVRCARAGASAFVPKDSDPKQLISAVQVVLSGYKLFPINEYSSVDGSATLASEKELIETLSDRELTVLRALGRGHRIRDIASELLLSEKTVSTYKSRLIAKLQVGNFLELVELAKRNDLV
ncbi:response regulator transcription factor [Pseudomonas turukhanskensis]|uniref:response regulator transcription factor n=1 Tax=Pseudomonas turukhanskensis TaxID=1806536 RepID=UPI0022F31E34|nr:response regulator transcription factor [Pseudomonas turukhanskensis]